MKVCERYPLHVDSLSARIPIPPEGVPGITSFIPNAILSAIVNKGVGIEIEVENCCKMECPPGWLNTKDPSLRNNGIEFITRYGLRVGGALEVLNNLANQIDRLRVKHPNAFEFTERTSVHIHLDCRHFNETQLESLLILYTLAEKPLFNFAGDHRKHNVFCVPLFSSGMQTNYSIWDLADTWEKYCAINLTTLKTYGTVEFRHMEGNINPKRIMTWIVLLALIHDAARRIPLEEIKRKVNEIKLDSHYLMTLENIFFGYISSLRWDDRDIDMACSDSKLFFTSKDN